MGKSRGIDIRKEGSGNIGATNVFRVLGKRLGIVVLAIDALKGYIGCKFFPGLAFGWLGRHAPVDAALLEYVSIASGLAAIAGHNYPVWIGFKGGKGIATSAGVMLALVPLGLAMALGVWLIVVALTRYVSLGSVAAAAALPAAVWLSHGSGRLIAVGGVVGAMAIYRHRSNIQRLLQGTENKIGKRPRTEL